MTEIMGVLNVTTDSFSDGGTHVGVDAAIAHGMSLVAQGATIVDVGGESTRPGATPVPQDEEANRVVPVIRALTDSGVSVSVDTIHAATAEASARAGAAYINDVSGGLHDPDMLEVAAAAATRFGTKFIIGHWRGVPDQAHERSTYTDVVHEVRDALAELASQAIAAGVPGSHIVLDPGLGFDKTGPQCWEILNRLDEIQALGYPVLIGASRKRMLADVLADVPGSSEAPDGRDLATAVVTALCAKANAWGVRVHDALGSAQAIAVVAAWQTASAPGTPAPTVLVPSAPVEDKLTLTGLEVFAHHGVFDFERVHGQKFLIDVEVTSDLRAAAVGDDLAATVNYGELAIAIADAVERDPVDLIETVAERVAEVALGFTAVSRVTATIHKPFAPIDRTFNDVSVSITRERAA